MGPPFAQYNETAISNCFSRLDRFLTMADPEVTLAEQWDAFKSYYKGVFRLQVFDPAASDITPTEIFEAGIGTYNSPLPFNDGLDLFNECTNVAKETVTEAAKLVGGMSLVAAFGRLIVEALDSEMATSPFSDPVRTHLCITALRLARTPPSIFGGEDLFKMADQYEANFFLEPYNDTSVDNHNLRYDMVLWIASFLKLVGISQAWCLYFRLLMPMRWLLK